MLGTANCRIFMRRIKGMTYPLAILRRKAELLSISPTFDNIFSSSSYNSVDSQRELYTPYNTVVDQ